MRKIGFWAENEQSKEQKNETTQFKTEKTEAKESVVRVYFPARGFACSYYNDKFDLKKATVFTLKASSRDFWVLSRRSAIALKSSFPNTSA